MRVAGPRADGGVETSVWVAEAGTAEAEGAMLDGLLAALEGVLRGLAGAGKGRGPALHFHLYDHSEMALLRGLLLRHLASRESGASVARLLRILSPRTLSARPDLVRGVIQHTEYVQYDLTPQQYAALIKLTAALATVFPKIKVDYPRDAAGNLITAKLPDDQLAAYQGVLGHYHVQENKQDPGPALQWDKLIDGARKLMKLPPIKKPKAAAN